MDQNKNNKRYDRQLRIWGAAGQNRLGSANVCVLGAGATGSEVLKNLVLGGIASFTLVDGATVDTVDTGNNFFVCGDSVGKPRAQVVTQYVQELNESVVGQFISESPDYVINDDVDFFKQFTVVVACQLRTDQLLPICTMLQPLGIPLVILRSYGLYGHVSICGPPHHVVQSRPDTTTPDLRLNTPWSELTQYAESIVLDELDTTEYKHVPFPIILMHATQQWRAGRGGQGPCASDSRAFREHVRDMARPDVSGGGAADGDNIAEASKAVYQVWAKYEVPKQVQALFEECHVSKLLSSERVKEVQDGGGGLSEGECFWLCIAGLKMFVGGEGCGKLPLEGSLPDMTSSTERYVQLQRIYREKAEADVAHVRAHVHHILAGLGLAVDLVPDALISLVCKNSRNVCAIKWSALRDRVAAGSSASSANSSALAAALCDEHTCHNGTAYVALTAADEFFALNSRYPGTPLASADVDADVAKLNELCGSWLQKSACQTQSVWGDVVLEVVRCGAGEVHCVAAVIGGIGAQEVIKLVTGQFVPLEGVLLYNGIHGSSCVINI